MIGRASALPDVLPELRRYLLEYPNAELAGADSFFYWEKVSFGLKPTIRVNHAVIYRGRSQGRDFGVVAIKQLYATHYFHTALDMSVCVDDGATVAPHGFYLLTLKGSEQEGLTGVKGSILRKVVVDKTRSSLESALASIKRSVEVRAPSLTWMPACLTPHNIPRRSHSVRSSGQCSSPRPRWSSTFVCLIVRPFLNVIAWSSVLVIRRFIPCTSGSCGRRDACR